MAIDSLLNPAKEFLVMKHRVLNNPEADIRQESDRVLEQLNGATNGREIVLAVEGDYHLPGWSDHVILAHRNFFLPSKKEFRQLREARLASYLAEAIDNVLDYESTTCDVIACFESKARTPIRAHEKLLEELRVNKVKRAYVDSFFLKDVTQWSRLNRENHTPYKSSYHCALAGPLCIGFRPTFLPSGYGADIVTIPYGMAWGSVIDRSIPIIYGAVGSKNKVANLSEDPNVLGVYWRGDEAKSWRMFLNSTSGAKKRF